MKNGLLMQGVYMINKHDYLDNSLPEANTLDLYGINKPAFTQSKNNILKSIREMIANKEDSVELKKHIQNQINQVEI